MKGALALRVPCGTAAALDSSTTNITNAAYVQLQAATTDTCSAVMVSNSGAQPILLATGGAGSEVNSGVVIPPLCEGVTIPMNIKKGTRLSLKSLLSSQSTGIVSVMFQQ